MTIDEMIDSVVAEYGAEPRAILRAILCGLARTHLLDEDAYPDFAVSEDKTAGSGALREILALQHWISRPLWRFGKSMPPLQSLLEAVWMSMSYETWSNEEAAERLEARDDLTIEEDDLLIDLDELAHHQDAARALLEEAVCRMDEQRMAAGRSISGGSIPFPRNEASGE